MVAMKASDVVAQSWSSWEQANAISQHRAFLVIRDPDDGSCYVKQSYYEDPSKMELIFKGASPTIITPFYRGIDGDVLYWVDDSPRYTARKSNINATIIDMNADVVAQMKTGHVLYVSINPSGQLKRTQSFSLLGFTAATDALSSPECREDEGAGTSPNLEVKLTRNSDGRVVITGFTSLPDGMRLMISLRDLGGSYFAQDKVQIRSGSYESAAFSDKGAALPPGEYRVYISSPLMDLQPASVREHLSSTGASIPKDLRKKSDIGDNYTVYYSVLRLLK